MIARSRTTALTPTLTLAALGALAVGAGLSHTGSQAQQVRADIPVLPVQAAAVRFGAGEGDGGAGTGAAFAAVIRHDREAQLALRVPGRIVAYPAHIGDRLGAGALIAALDATPYAAAQARAQADLDRAGRAAERHAALAQDGAVAGAQAADSADAARAAQAAVQAARYDVQSTRLTMPFAGAVIARRGEVGEVAAAGQVLVTVADQASPLVAAAQVPAALAQGLRRGQAASVTLASGQRLTAHVLRKAAAADPRSGLVQVDLALPAGAGALSGMAASVGFAGGETPSGAPGAVGGQGTIPAEAVLEAQGATAFVYVIDAAGRARRKAVGLQGFVDRDAVISGLPAGTQVVTKGAGFVSDGQRVQVMP